MSFESEVKRLRNGLDAGDDNEVTSIILDFPPHIRLEILKDMSFADIIKLRQVNSKVRDIIDNFEDLWSMLYNRNFASQISLTTLSELLFSVNNDRFTVREMTIAMAGRDAIIFVKREPKFKENRREQRIYITDNYIRQTKLNHYHVQQKRATEVEELLTNLFNAELYPSDKHYFHAYIPRNQKLGIEVNFLIVRCRLVRLGYVPNFTERNTPNLQCAICKSPDLKFGLNESDGPIKFCSEKCGQQYIAQL